MAEDFDLSRFITGSLCLRGNTNPTVHTVFPSKDPLAAFLQDDPYNVVGDVPFSEQAPVSKDTVGTPIQEFYRGVNVFLTGGSGFIGKVVTEKLVRSIPHIGHIFLLMREKKGKGSKERLQLLLEDKLYSRMKVEVPDYLSKITVLTGDLTEPGLGLSGDDLQLALTAQVVFHCAADVRFLEPLRVAISSNVLGSKHVMDLARQMKHLKAYVHVSTAYSQCVNRVIEEAVPKTSINYKDIIAFVDSNTDSYIEENLQSILQGWPNTYTFSKALCENMIEEESKGLPICIYRPSIVTSTYKEPLKGWSDNLHGAIGLMFASAMGVMHHYQCDITAPLDLVPVDYVANSMIGVSWDVGMKRGDGCLYVYNFTSTQQNMLTWNVILNSTAVDQYAHALPYKHNIWYPSLMMVDSHIFDEICHLFLHKIPGEILDKIAVILGKKPRLSKVYSLLYTLKTPLNYFTSRVWEFKNENLLNLWHSMNKEDKEIFNFDLRDVNWLEYEAVAWLGMRYFYLKENMESLPEARTKVKWLHRAHITLKVACGLLVVKLAACVAHVLPF